MRKLQAERSSPRWTAVWLGAILALVGPPESARPRSASRYNALGRWSAQARWAACATRPRSAIGAPTSAHSRAGLVRALRMRPTRCTRVIVARREVADKLGADFHRGDLLFSALLEVPDPALYHTFRDHYLEVDLRLCRRLLHRHGQHHRDRCLGLRSDRMEVIHGDGLHGAGKGLHREAPPGTGIASSPVPRCNEDRGGEVTDEGRCDRGGRLHPRGRCAELSSASSADSLRKVATKLESGERQAARLLSMRPIDRGFGSAARLFESAERTAFPASPRVSPSPAAGGDVLYA